MMTYHVQFLLLVLAGWVNRQQQDVIDYQQEENRVLNDVPAKPCILRHHRTFALVLDKGKRPV